MLNLPIAPIDLLQHAIDPALDLLPKFMGHGQARQLLIAIAIQETDLCTRCQKLEGGGRGPARGLWQFERGTKQSRGGVWGVYLHHLTSEHLRLLCRDRDVNYDPYAIWDRLEHDDVLAAGVARLLIYTDLNPLPGTEYDAWQTYLHAWRPGKPRPESWRAAYEAASLAITTH